MSWEGRRLVGYKEYENGVKVLEVTYTYNDGGYRTSKTINGVKTEYYLEGDKVLAEKRGDDVIHYFYDVDGSLIGFRYNNNDYFYVKNIQGDITYIVDESGNVVVRYVYDTWGNILI